MRMPAALGAESRMLKSLGIRHSRIMEYFALKEQLHAVIQEQKKGEKEPRGTRTTTGVF